MSHDVDLSELAIERPAVLERTSPIGPGAHLLTRYVLPGMLLMSALALVAWAAHDLVFPPQQVRLMPVVTAQATGQPAGHDVVPGCWLGGTAPHAGSRCRAGARRGAKAAGGRRPAGRCG